MNDKITMQNRKAATITRESLQSVEAVTSVPQLKQIEGNYQKLVEQCKSLQQECKELRKLKVIKQSLVGYFDRVVELTADEKTKKIIELTKENEFLKATIDAHVDLKLAIKDRQKLGRYDDE